MKTHSKKSILTWVFNALFLAFWAVFAVLVFGLWQPPAGKTNQAPIDGANVRYIPSGEFIMGMNYNPPYEDTTHTVFTSGYWIYQTQVTNQMFAECVKQGKCSYRTVKEINPHYYNAAYADHPVVYVLWKEAEEYCSWAGGRLPTEAEWEKAARGPSGAEYPWKNNAQTHASINVNNTVGDTVPVGSYPQNQSAYGVLDMGSNVREWVQDWFGSNSYVNDPRNNPAGPSEGTYKVLKGAGFDDPETFTRAAHRLKHVPNSPGNNRGFRCVIPSIKQTHASTIGQLQAKMHTKLNTLYLKAEPFIDLDKFLRIISYYGQKLLPG